jgi:hypothetical protein
MSKGEKGALILDDKISFKGEQGKSSSSESKKATIQKISNNKKISDFFPEKNAKTGSVQNGEILNQESKSRPNQENDFTQKKRLRTSIDSLKEQKKNPMVVELDDFRKQEKINKSQKTHKIDSADLKKKKKDNRSSCSICRLGGELLLCDNCPKSFHFECLKMKSSDIPEGEWYCTDCL